MSLACCGVCGEEIGPSIRCIHQPAPPVISPSTEPVTATWLEELLADCTDGELVGDLVIEEPTDEELNIGIPRWARPDSEPLERLTP